MEEQFLIAHKCRGQSAFEVAEKQECAVCRGIGCNECNGDGFWWITHYGHRAYPYWTCAIPKLMVANGFMNSGGYVLPPMPSDLPEHFEASAAPKGKGVGIDGRSILEKLGLAKPLEPMRRW